jgi:hypothetical protein
LVSGGGNRHGDEGSAAYGAGWRRAEAAGLAFAEGRDTIAGRSPTDLGLSSLPGNVGLVRAEHDRLVVVRSGAGTVPWYAWQDAERTLVTTTFTELVRMLPALAERCDVPTRLRPPMGCWVLARGAGTELVGARLAEGTQHP